VKKSGKSVQGGEGDEGELRASEGGDEDAGLSDALFEDAGLAELWLERGEKVGDAHGEEKKALAAARKPLNNEIGSGKIQALRMEGTLPC
jgi:hypothetical protein